MRGKTLRQVVARLESRIQRGRANDAGRWARSAIKRGITREGLYD